MMRHDPNPRGSAMPTNATLADRLVDFVLATRFEDLPHLVVVEAKRRAKVLRTGSSSGV